MMRRIILFYPPPTEKAAAIKEKQTNGEKTQKTNIQSSPRPKTGFEYPATTTTIIPLSLRLLLLLLLLLLLIILYTPRQVEGAQLR